MNPQQKPRVSEEASDAVGRLEHAIEEMTVWDEHVEGIALNAARALVGAATCNQHTLQALCRVGLSEKGARALVSQVEENHIEQGHDPDPDGAEVTVQCPVCARYADGAHEAPQTATRWRFNWGALLITPIWLLGHRFWLWGAIYIAGMVLLTAAEVRMVKSLIHIAFAIWLASRGDRMLWATGRYKTVEELRRSERAWAIFALVSSALVCVLLLLLIVSIQ